MRTTLLLAPWLLCLGCGERPFVPNVLLRAQYLAHDGRNLATSSERAETRVDAVASFDELAPAAFLPEPSPEPSVGALVPDAPACASDEVCAWEQAEVLDAVDALARDGVTP